MDISIINKRVHKYYWDNNFNCATAMLKILAEIFEVKIYDQTYDAVIGMPGAGGYGAQCGLVEGAIIFIGIYGRVSNMADEDIKKSCYSFADSFKKNFGYLNCSELRPEGFRPENPPHLCEDFTKKAVGFTAEFLRMKGGNARQGIF